MKQREEIDVVIADKNPLVLLGLKALFAEHDNINIIATASDGERFLDALDRLRFDVGIIGWGMPYCNGAEVLRIMKERGGNLPRIIVYSGASSPIVPKRVMSLGGAGFYSKKQDPEDLVDILNKVAQGSMVFPFVDISTMGNGPMDNLSNRELEALEYLGQGQSNQQIAKSLNISINTVKFHLKNLYEKLGIRNRAQAVAFYMSNRKL